MLDKKSSPRSVTIGAKVTPDLAAAADQAIRNDPTTYKDKSEFVRKAVIRLLSNLQAQEQAVTPQPSDGEESRSSKNCLSVNRKAASNDERSV